MLLCPITSTRRWQLRTASCIIDDLYVFHGDGSTVFVMDVNSNVTGLHVEPGFHPEARYEFKVHFDGADFETLTYRVSFGEPDSDGQQALQLHALTGAEARDDSATGDLVLEGRTGETASADGTPDLGRTHRRLVLHRPVAAGDRQRGSQQRDRGGPLGMAAGRREEQLRRHHRRLDRAGGLPRAPAAAARCPHRACGAPPSSPPTRAAGGRSTAPGTR